MDCSMKHYRINLWGYGGEAAYIGITKEQYEYWNAVKNDEDRDDGESDIIDYMVDPEEYLQENTIPEEMDFLMWKGDFEEDDFNKYHNPWYDAPNEFAHSWGATADCRLTITEVDSGEYMSNHVADVVDGQDARDIEDRLMDKGVEFIQYGTLTELGGEQPAVEPDYVCQFWSSEKGTFFDGILSIDEKFDIKKLKLITEEYPNGDDCVIDVQYDGESIDNNGGDTNGKGYTVNFWSNVKNG